MRKFELKRITAALRQMSPMQRKIVATELAALDAQPVAAGIDPDYRRAFLVGDVMNTS